MSLRSIVLHGRLVDDCDHPAVVSGDQPPLAAPGCLLFRLFGQRPPSALPVHDDRHFGDQVVLELAQHQIVFHFVARRDAIADVVEVVEQVVGQVHVGNTLFGDARQLGLVVGSTAATATTTTAATTAPNAAHHQPQTATAAVSATDESDSLHVQRRFHHHHFLRLDGE